MVRNINKKPKHLPERLTIAFPIWGLFDTDENGVYHNLDKFVLEHKERGYNCIRLDSGAGLMHDIEGKLLGEVKIGYAFGEYDKKMRQFGVCPPGKCDFYKRLIGLFTAAQKHGVYIILSSWYFLHTYWYFKERGITDYIFSLDPHSYYMLFAKYLHYILEELEKLGLINTLAFAEIFNEADGLYFSGGYGNQFECSETERLKFKVEHKEAIDFLKKNHPDIMFCYDVSGPEIDGNLAPENAEVFNFHSYFMWSAYDEYENNPYWLKEDACTLQDVKNSTAYPERMPKDWIERVQFFANLDKNKIAEGEKFLQDNFKANINKHIDKFERNLRRFEKSAAKYFPEALYVCGEGVSYCGAYELQWEEKSPEYWNLLKECAYKYREIGLWGTVVRTCCGPEDPSWYKNKEDILKINNVFLYGNEKGE